ncbi:hypothetical protein K438DRAFT_1926184, partial [Mycena galopus ATCC 62051]
MDVDGDKDKKDFEDELEMRPVFSSIVHDGPELYVALEHCLTIDIKWTIQALVKNCTEDHKNPLTAFAVGVPITLEAYDPMNSATSTSFFAKAAQVISALDGTPSCPAGPWDVYWALPGYPWLIGPFAHRHGEGEEIEINSSEAILREIPVVGSEDVLRLVVVFKHPNDTGREILSLPPQEHNMEYVNHIKP